MSKEAMKLVLEGAANYIDALGGDSRKYRQALSNEALDKMAENARELGLDYGPAQEPVAYWIPKAKQFCIADPSGRPFAKAWEPLYTTPQPAQREDWGPGPHEYHSLPEPEQPAQQEPVAYLVDGDLYYPEEIDWETLQEQGHTVAALYTSPPAQRTWVGLTEPERLACYDLNPARFASAIEAKLKEKNT